VIAGSNPIEGMDVRLLRLLCVISSGLCDELIARPEKSYRVRVRPIVCDIKPQQWGDLKLTWAVATQTLWRCTISI